MCDMCDEYAHYNTEACVIFYEGKNNTVSD